MKLIELHSVNLGTQLLYMQAGQLAFLAATVWLLVRCCARNRPFIAHALWCVVLIKALCPPLLATPASLFGWLENDVYFLCNDATSASDANIELAREPINEFVNDGFAQKAAEDGIGGRPTGSSVSQNLPAESEERNSETAFRNARQELPLRQSREAYAAVPLESPKAANAGDRGWSLDSIVLAFWLSCSLLMFLLAMVRLGFFLRTIRQIGGPAPAFVFDIADRLTQKLELSRLPEILILDATIGPAIVGFLRPKVLLPRCIVDSVNPSQLEHILAHELVHFKRSDLRWSALQLISSCLWWFHPAIWLSHRQLSLETERRCDLETIARLGCSPKAYALSLVSILERKHSLSSAPMVPGVRPMDITSNRMQRIMNLRHGTVSCPRWAPGIVLLLGCLLAIPGANWSSAQEVAELESGQTAKADVRQTNSYAGKRSQVAPAEPALIPNLPRSKYFLRELPVGLLLQQIQEDRNVNAQQAAEFLESLVDDYFAEHQDSRHSLFEASVSRATIPNVQDAAGAHVELINALGSNRKVIGQKLYAYATANELQLLSWSLFRSESVHYGGRELQLEVLECSPAMLKGLGGDWANYIAPYFSTIIDSATWQDWKANKSQDSWLATKSQSVGLRAATVDLAPHWDRDLIVRPTNYGEYQARIELSFSDSSDLHFLFNCRYGEWICIVQKPNREEAASKVVAVRFNALPSNAPTSQDRWVAVTHKLSEKEIVVFAENLTAIGVNAKDVRVDDGAYLVRDDGITQRKVGGHFLKVHSYNISMARRAYQLFQLRRLASSFGIEKSADPSVILVEDSKLKKIPIDQPWPMRRLLDERRQAGKLDFGGRFIVVPEKWTSGWYADLIRYEPKREDGKLDPIDYVALRDGDLLFALRDDQAIDSEEQLRQVIAEAWPVDGGLKVDMISASADLAKQFEEAAQKTKTSMQERKQKLPEKFADLTLQECVRIALQNAPHFRVMSPSEHSGKTKQTESLSAQPLLRGRGNQLTEIPVVVARIDEDISIYEQERQVHALVYSVETAYWDLLTSYRTLEAAQQGLAKATDIWRMVESGDAEFLPEAEAQSRALYAQFKANIHSLLFGSSVPGHDPLGLYGREKILRQTMGWAVEDGNLIRPSDTPRTTSYNLDWDDCRKAAYQNNPTLQELQNQFLGFGEFADQASEKYKFPETRQLLNVESSLPVGLRRELARSRVDLHKERMIVEKKLQFAYRSVWSNYSTLKDYDEQMLANEDELSVYVDKIAADPTQLPRLVDHILRAEERRTRAQSLYHQTTAEFNKSIAQLHYLMGDVLRYNLSNRNEVSGN